MTYIYNMQSPRPSARDPETVVAAPATLFAINSRSFPINAARIAIAGPYCVFNMLTLMLMLMLTLMLQTQQRPQSLTDQEFVNQ